VDLLPICFRCCSAVGLQRLHSTPGSPKKGERVIVGRTLKIHSLVCLVCVVSCRCLCLCLRRLKPVGVCACVVRNRLPAAQETRPAYQCAFAVTRLCLPTTSFSCPPGDLYIYRPLFKWTSGPTDITGLDDICKRYRSLACRMHNSNKSYNITYRVINMSFKDIC